MKILISGGGTGGHLIPGIALYEEVKKRGFDCRYVLREQDLRYPVTSRIDEADRVLVNIQGISRKLSLKTPVYILKLVKAFFNIRSRIKSYNPDIVITTGGYVSNPVAFSAGRLKKPLFIVEQNSVAGATNRFYSKKAKIVFTAFPETLKLRTNRVFNFGNPSIFSQKSERSEALEYFNLSGYEKVIGVTGGSQGAMIVNGAVKRIIPELKKRNVAVIWSAGAVDYQRIEESGLLSEFTEKYPNVRIYRFIERMDLLFSACDSVISRAGATSIAEFIHFEMPTILIPITDSPDNHQFLNANYLAENDAGVLLRESELTDESLLSKIDYSFLHQADIKKGLSGMKHPNPSKRIIDEILKNIK